MMKHTFDFRPRLQLAAEALLVHGWTRGKMRDSAGRMCLTGAIRYCAPQTGDEYIIREVFRKRGRAEAWNDREAAGAGEVIEYLWSTDITDADLYDTFGPQALEIVALIRRMFTVTAEQWENLIAARNADWEADGAQVASRDAAEAAAKAGSFGWNTAATTRWIATQEAVQDATSRNWSVTPHIRDVALALQCRSLIGNQFTQEHYDLLTGPWRRTIGKIHPDDPDVMTDKILESRDIEEAS